MTKEEELSREALITGEARCGKCVYYHAAEEQCRFNPPVPNSGFPLVKETDWCGRYMYDTNLDDE